MVGAGSVMAAAHLPAALSSTTVQVVALVDPTVERASRLAHEFGISPRVTETVGEILPEIDGAVIATPNHTHCELALECIEAGVSCLIEKPLATSVSEGEAIIRAAEQHRITVAVSYPFRFVGSVPLMRTLLESQHFGKLRRFAYQVGTRGGWAPVSGYNLDRRSAGGGVLVVTGTHFLDQLLYWFGYPDDFEYQDDSLGGPEANALAVFRYSNSGSTFEGMARFSKTVPLKEGIVMETAQGIVIVRDGIRFRPRAQPSLEILLQRRSGNQQPSQKGMFQLQLEDFVAACREKREPMVSARQGLESLRLIEALYSRRSPMKTDGYRFDFKR